MTPDERADLTERMVPVACELAGLVREEGPGAIARFFRRVTRDEIPVEARALMVVLAAMVPDDATPADLLSWADWDAPERPARDLMPCGTRAAYARHKRAGEDPEPCGCGKAFREYRERLNAERREARAA